MEIKWTDTDPATGVRRFVCAERFARQWTYKSRLTRRGVWTQGVTPNLDMWETLLDGLERRYRRREGVSEADVHEVQVIVNALRDRQRRLAPPEVEEE